MQKEKIRIRLESYNHEILTNSCSKLIDLLENFELDKIGIAALPTDKRIYCVLKSPHVDEDSREHFELRLHKRIIDIHYDSTVEIFDIISKCDLPSAVLFKIYLS